MTAQAIEHDDHGRIAHHDPLARLLPARGDDEGLYPYLDRLSGFEDALRVVLAHPGVNVEELRGLCSERSLNVLSVEVAALGTSRHPQPQSTRRLHVVRPAAAPTGTRPQPAD